MAWLPLLGPPSSPHVSEMYRDYEEGAVRVDLFHSLPPSPTVPNVELRHSLWNRRLESINEDRHVPEIDRMTVVDGLVWKFNAYAATRAPRSRGFAYQSP